VWEGVYVRGPASGSASGPTSGFALSAVAPLTGRARGGQSSPLFIVSMVCERGSSKDIQRIAKGLWQAFVCSCAGGVLSDAEEPR